YLGCTFAGARMLKEKGNKLLNFLGEIHGNSSIIGFNKKASIESAVFLNGLSAHIAELDDGVISGIVHPGSPIFSALLPVAEKEKVKDSDLITGIITGYEAAVRIADAIQPSHKKRGYHATATCGTIGAALGITAMLDFSKSQMKDALSSASVSAHGTLKVLEDSSELKPYNVGQAALSGLLSVSMAKAGFKGSDDPLSGNSGFFSMMADQYDLTYLKNTGTFGIERVYYKPYAACRYCHPAIEAALKLRFTHSINLEKIKTINVATYHLAVANHDHTTINGISSAKMSIPYSVAVALMSGKAGINEFSNENINNSDISSLTQKISINSDDQLSALFPKKSAAIVEIITDDGFIYKERVDNPKGEPENPLSDDEIKEKFITLSTYGNKSNEESQEIIRIVRRLENELHKLFSLL
ncbi:MmgE/PrpD family protein, partial [Bacteroidota bacterium]